MVGLTRLHLDDFFDFGWGGLCGVHATIVLFIPDLGLVCPISTPPPELELRGCQHHVIKLPLCLIGVPLLRRAGFCLGFGSWINRPCACISAAAINMFAGDGEASGDWPVVAVGSN